MEEEFEGEPRFGGHDFVFVDELSPGQTCPVCLLAMRSPVQTVCGHRFCESCLLGTFREGHDQVCPQDRNPIREDGGFFRDVAWGRDILSLRVKCKKSERGCEWTGQLRHYEEHFNLCEYEDVTCDDCNEEMQRRLLHKHATSECHNRIVQCEYCEEEFAFWLTESHKHNECTRFPLDCPQECGVQDIPREEVESHVRDDCVMTMVVCPYEGAGCTFHDKRSNLNDHLDALNEEHLRKTWSKLLKTTERLNELEAVEGQIEELQTDKESMKRLLDSNSEEISDLKLSEKKLEVENLALKKNLAALQKQLEEVKLTAADDKEEVRSLKAEYNALKKDVEELRSQFKEVKCTSALESMPTKSEENTSYNSVWDLPKYGYRENCVLNDTTEKDPCEANLVESIEGAPENNEVKQRLYTESSAEEPYSNWAYKYHESVNRDSVKVDECLRCEKSSAEEPCSNSAYKYHESENRDSVKVEEWSCGERKSKARPTYSAPKPLPTYSVPKQAPLTRCATKPRSSKRDWTRLKRDQHQ